MAEPVCAAPRALRTGPGQCQPTRGIAAIDSPIGWRREVCLAHDLQAGWFGRSWPILPVRIEFWSCGGVHEAGAQERIGQDHWPEPAPFATRCWLQLGEQLFLDVAPWRGGQQHLVPLTWSFGQGSRDSARLETEPSRVQQRYFLGACRRSVPRRLTEESVERPGSDGPVGWGRKLMAPIEREGSRSP